MRFLAFGQRGSVAESVPRFYRVWFYAAAVYNLVWGLAAALFPLQVATVGGLGHTSHLQLVQVIGMMVGVYGLGYYFLARDPARYSGFIWIGLLGKVLGPLGFFSNAIQGGLPWDFGWIVLFNDIIWWPVFFMFALRYARHPLSESASAPRSENPNS